MNTIPGLSLVVPSVQVMTPIVAWSSVLIDPTGQCTAHPIMPPLPRRRDDRQPTRACPPKPDPRP